MFETDLERLMDELQSRYFGKYRGKVTANQDPQKRGGIEVMVPSVLGEQKLWALPCVPYAGPKVGFFAIPPVGAGVWVEFEEGRPGFPIWTGCFWAEGEIDSADASPDIAFWRTDGATIRIDATAGMLEIETAGGAKLTMTGTEIKLEAQSIKQSAGAGATSLDAGGFDAMNGALKVM